MTTFSIVLRRESRGCDKYQNNFFGGGVIQKIEGTVLSLSHFTLTLNQTHPKSLDFRALFLRLGSEVVSKI